MIVSGFSWIFSWGGWLWANDVSVPRKVTPGLPGWIFFYTVPRPHFLGRALIWTGYFGEHVLGLFGLYLSSFFKVCGIRFSIWESFIGFYICCYPISTILACLFSVGVRISRKKLCWKGAWRRKWHLVSPTLYVIIVYRVNLNKLSRNFVATPFFIFFLFFHFCFSHSNELDLL